MMVGYHGLQHLKRVKCMPRLIFDNIYIPPVISVTPWNDCTEVHAVHDRQDGTIITTSFSIQYLEE